MASMRTERSATWLNLDEYMGLLLNALEAEAGFAQGVADGGDVGCAAGFQGYIDGGFAQADAVVGAIVDGFDDVGALAGQYLGEGVQSAGAVLKVDADAKQAPILDQAALDDLGQQGDVNVASADQDDGAAMANFRLGLDAGGQSGGAGPFGQGFLLLQKQENGPGDFFVVAGDDFVDVAGDKGEGQVAGAADGDAVGDGGLGCDGTAEKTPV